MGRKTGAKVLLFLGAALFLHALHSAAEHNTFLRVAERSSEGLPIDVIAEALLSLLLVAQGAVAVSGDFCAIHEAAIHRADTWAAVDSRPGFWTFTDPPPFEEEEDDQDGKKEKAHAPKSAAEKKAD